MVRRAFLAVSIIVSLGACEPEAPQAPQLHTDRDSLGFGQEFGSGAFIGQGVSNTLLLFNEGLEDLVLSGVDLSQPGNEFALRPLSLPATLAYRDELAITIDFMSCTVATYTGTLTITSNAENTPSKVVALSARTFDVTPTPQVCQ